MYWRKKKKFTDDAIAYLKASHPDKGTSTLELPVEATPVVKRYSDDLCICYLVDRGSSYEYVQKSHIEQDDIDREALHHIGLSNLRALVGRRQARVQPYQGVFTFLMHGDFEASIILLDDFWEHEFRQFVKGEFAAAIPARDVLAFCDSSSADGIAELDKIIRRLEPTGDHLLTQRIHVRQNSRWIPRES